MCAMAGSSTSTMQHAGAKIAIVGSGLIGRSWAMLFVSAGHPVCMYDIERGQLDRARESVLEQLEGLANRGLLRGTLTVQQQFQLLSVTENLGDCVKDAVHVQECVPEILEMKKDVFRRLDEFADGDIVLCSSSSAIIPSLFTEGLKNKSKCMVAHPINPPFYCRLVELVPAPWTDLEVVTKTRALIASIGQAPITLKKEVMGFIQPRIQYALIGECWRLVQDGVISVEDVDTAVVEGLGARYAFMGPFETCHLNADGFRSYCERYGKGIYEVQKSFGEPELMAGEKAQAVENEVSQWVPVETLPDRRQWRDKRLAALAKLRQDLDK